MCYGSGMNNNENTATKMIRHKGIENGAHSYRYYAADTIEQMDEAARTMITAMILNREMVPPMELGEGSEIWEVREHMKAAALYSDALKVMDGVPVFKYKAFQEAHVPLSPIDFMTNLPQFGSTITIVSAGDQKLDETLGNRSWNDLLTR